MMEINIWAVLACGVASMVIGSIWYGALFGKMYNRLMGMDTLSTEEREKMKKSMGMMYAMQCMASMVMFYVLAWLMVNLGRTDIAGGIHEALVTWLGLTVTIQLGHALWGGTWKLFWLGAGNSLISPAVGGIILGLWR